MLAERFQQPAAPALLEWKERAMRWRTESLNKQTVTRTRLGEILGMRLQRIVRGYMLAAILAVWSLSLSGCGSGASDTTSTAAAVVDRTTASTPDTPVAGGGTAVLPGVDANYFTVTSDDYGLIKPNFLYSTDNGAFWSIEANVARSATDIDTAGVYRIDIPKNGGPLPELNHTFAIEDGTSYDKFPGTFLISNGKKSTSKKVESGIISFSPDSSASGKVTGTFDVTMTDYDANVFPAPQFHLKGSFRFVMGTYGPAAAGA